MTIVVSMGLSMALMPVLMLLSVLLLFVVGMNERGYSRSLEGCRVPRAVVRRMRVYRWLIWAWIVEFAALMVVGWVWPRALNFW